MQEYGDETASLKKHAKNDIASFTTALNVHQLFYSAVLWTIFQMTNFQIQDDEFCKDRHSTKPAACPCFYSGLNVATYSADIDKETKNE